MATGGAMVTVITVTVILTDPVAFIVKAGGTVTDMVMSGMVSGAALAMDMVTIIRIIESGTII